MMELTEAPASITSKGAILLGKQFTVDGYAERPIRIVTHAHNDHLRGLRSSIRRGLFVIATPITFEFLRVLGYILPEEKIIGLPYYRKLDIDNETVSLLPARHIAGSAQVVVEGSSYRVGYTGDFKVPGTPPLRDLDILVLDATYGSPRLQRRWSDFEALSALIALIEEHIWDNPVWVYGYHGKLQEVLLELRSRGVKYPVYADAKTIALARIASQYEKQPIDPVRVLEDPLSIEPGSLVLAHAMRRRVYKRYPGVHVFLTGWEMRGVIVRTGPNSFNVSFSDHATFREILEYVREASPKQVIVDASRGSDAWLTAKYISRYLGIPATAMP